MTENNREKRTNQMSKTKCHRITTVSVLIEYMGDRSVVAFDFETASDANRDKERRLLPQPNLTLSDAPTFRLLIPPERTLMKKISFPSCKTS